MESAITSRLAFLLMRRSSRTWRSQVFPTSVTTGVLAASNSFRLASWAGFADGLRVVPKAATRVFLRSRFRTAWKNSASRGLDPGKPPST